MTYKEDRAQRANTRDASTKYLLSHCFQSKSSDRTQYRTATAKEIPKGETMASSKQIIVASKNPVKITAALEGFQRMIPGNTYATRGITVPSGVPDQPLTDAETLQGAVNRARNAQEQEPQADYWIGIEGGVEDTHDQAAGTLQSFAWVVIIDRTGKTGKARTAAYYQPEEVAKLVRGGMELGHADDVVFGRSNSKQANGSVGLLTGDVITRETYYVPAVIFALIPFKNGELTF
jgi:inosine/xanthosine triphosphatase